MKNSSNLLNIRAICLFFVLVILGSPIIFGNPTNTERYVLRFSEKGYALLERQKEIIEQTQWILYDSLEYLNEESLKEIITQDVSSIDKFEEDGLLKLTLAYLGSHKNSFSLSADEVVKVKLCFEKYLRQILEENTQKFHELDYLRLAETNCSISSLEDFLSSFEGHETNPSEVFGELLYPSPIIRGRSFSF